MSLRIEATWERLAAATPEDRASSALLGIFYEKHCLTEAHDAFVGTTRQSVYLSAFRLAEWLAWNWWRLCHEPRAEHRADWAMAHRLSTIGGGYVWPDITVMSDGERAALVARPTRESPIEPLRYLSDIAIVVPVADLHDLPTGKPWLLIADSGRARRQQVTLGLVSAGKAEVLTGLQEGAVVIPSSS